MVDIYIDESGNLGEKDMNRFFVITSVIFLDKKRISNLAKNFKAKKQLKEIKGGLTKTVDRQTLINKINKKDDYFISYIILDKKNLEKKKLFEDNNILFNYLCSFLFKKTFKNSKEKIRLFFDNRTLKVKSGNSLFDYLRLKSYTEWNFEGELEISYLDSLSNNCIQIADLISNTIYQAYKYRRKHFYKQLVINNSIRFPQNRFLKD